LDDVEKPKIQELTAAILSVTRSAICGTDLHITCSTFVGVEPGTTLGHEAVGVDVTRPQSGPAAEQANQQSQQFEQEVRAVAL
jgi:threonine dehydrogenase-like Zn-dependent dehydrogenase